MCFDFIERLINWGHVAPYPECSVGKESLEPPMTPDELEKLRQMRLKRHELSDRNKAVLRGNFADRSSQVKRDEQIVKDWCN